jgi:hypothetical protein
MKKKHQGPLIPILQAALRRCQSSRRDISEVMTWLIGWVSSEQDMPHAQLSSAPLHQFMLTAEEQDLLIREQHLLRRELALRWGYQVRVHTPPAPTTDQMGMIRRSVDELAGLTPERRQAYPAYVLCKIFSQAMDGDHEENARLGEILSYAMRTAGRKTPPSDTRIRELFGHYVRTEDDAARLRQGWAIYAVLGRHAKKFYDVTCLFNELAIAEELSTTAIKMLLSGRQQPDDAAEANHFWSDIITPVAQKVARKVAHEHRADAAQEVQRSLLARDINYRELKAPTLISLNAYIQKSGESRLNDYRSAAMFKNEVSPRHSRRLRASGIKDIAALSISKSAREQDNSLMGFNELFEALSKQFKLSKKQLKEQMQILNDANQIIILEIGRSTKLSAPDVKRLHESLMQVATPRRDNA